MGEMPERLKNEVKEAIAKLKDKNDEVRANAASQLQTFAEQGYDISEAFVALGKALFDKDAAKMRVTVSEAAVRALVAAAGNGLDIDPALADLAKTLSSPNEKLKEAAAEAFKNGAKNGLIISAVIPTLVKALSAPGASLGVRSYLAGALYQVSQQGQKGATFDEQTTALIEKNM